VEKAAKERGYTFPILLDESGEVTKNYGVRGTPTIYLLDREGKLIGGAVGDREWNSDKAREIIKLLLQ
jgi:cytochrome c-type biogenesis protein